MSIVRRKEVLHTVISYFEDLGIFIKKKRLVSQKLALPRLDIVTKSSQN